MLLKKTNIEIYRCCLTDDKKRKMKEIPSWMFDQSICSRMKLTDQPFSNIDSLFELTHLFAEIFSHDCILSKDK